MAQHLLHGTLHATIYEVDALHGGGVRQGFLGKVYIHSYRHRSSFVLSILFFFCDSVSYKAFGSRCLDQSCIIIFRYHVFLDQNVMKCSSCFSSSCDSGNKSSLFSCLKLSDSGKR